MGMVKRQLLWSICALRQTHGRSLQYAHEARAVPNAESLDLHPKHSIGAERCANGLQFLHCCLHSTQLSHRTPSNTPVRIAGRLWASVGAQCGSHGDTLNGGDGIALRGRAQRGADRCTGRRDLHEDPFLWTLSKHDCCPHHLGDETVIVMHPFHSKHAIRTKLLRLTREGPNSFPKRLGLGVRRILPGEPPRRPRGHCDEKTFDFRHSKGRRWVLQR
mmetsp:Transcript_26418/g.61316  ORF Transcript_26418/g.61316 Transcript_26418/m.61316 type:complete len:218 (-) Transcript_26418:1187-1840(-)